MFLSNEINSYANSMFKHEVLNDQWIDKCSLYLKNIFKDEIEGKVVLDYAFGRGNWSMAFLKAGAKKVIAIDASKDNVDRFNAYLDKKNIDAIEVIHGNFLVEADYEFEIDIFWIYGILHHIEEVDKFLSILARYENDSSLFYIYVYPENSLRYFLVDNSRKLIFDHTENHYLNNIYYYINEARVRVRDDLVAPHIKWYTLKNLNELLNKHGLYIQKQDNDFYSFLNKKENFEFNPIQVLCSRKKNDYTYKDNSKISELDVLNDIFETVFVDIIKKDIIYRESIVIGLNNTYYSSLLKDDISYLINSLFIYLVNIIITKEIVCKNALVNDYLKLLDSSIRDLPREEYFSILGRNTLTKYLVENRIRL